MELGHLMQILVNEHPILCSVDIIRQKRAVATRQACIGYNFPRTKFLHAQIDLGLGCLYELEAVKTEANEHAQYLSLS